MRAYDFWINIIHLPGYARKPSYRQSQVSVFGTSRAAVASLHKANSCVWLWDELGRFPSLIQLNWSFFEKQSIRVCGYVPACEWDLFLNVISTRKHAKQTIYLQILHRGTQFPQEHGGGVSRWHAGLYFNKQLKCNHVWKYGSEIL